MISAIFLFNYKGDILISRIFRPDVKRSMADLFRIHVITSPQIRSPVSVVDGLTFCHLKHDNLYIVAAGRGNMHVAAAFELCHNLVNLGQSYFGKLNEDAIKANFVLLYELLDEVLDFGFPIVTDVDTLKLYLTSDSVRSDVVPTAQASKITIQATGTTSWRRPDIKYRRNEVFIDIIEDVNLLMSNNGTVLSSSVSGVIKVKSYLSGLPECRFGLNEKVSMGANGDNFTSKDGLSSSSSSPSPVKKLVDISDFQFHQCVKLGQFESDRTISFIPPDGEFELMRYRANDGLLLPFKIHPVVNYISQTRLEYKINIKALFPRKYTATNVVVKIPTPLTTVTVNGIGNFTNGHGRARYVAGENCIIWKIPRITGLMEMDMTAEADLTPTFDKTKTWTRPPITLDFVVPMFTASGVQVRFLKVLEKSGYTTVKWVRYHAKSGNYQFRF